MDNAQSSQPGLSGNLRPQVIPADSYTLHWWRDTGCIKYRLLST